MQTGSAKMSFLIGFLSIGSILAPLVSDRFQHLIIQVNQCPFIIDKQKGTPRHNLVYMMILSVLLRSV